MTEFLPPVAITSGAFVVVAVDKPWLLYGFMLIVAVTCIIWSVSIINGCRKRRQRFEVLATRAARRDHADTDTDPT